MGMITDRSLVKKANGNDIWLTDPAPKGYGRFCARITKGGERKVLFYFKYTNSDGKREYIPLGVYKSSKESEVGLTLLEARTEAEKLSNLYRTGIRDLKAHLENERQLEIARIAAETSRLELERREAESRVTVGGFFDRWREEQLAGRKDGGTELARIFEKDVIPVIGPRYIAEISKGDITRIIMNIQKRDAQRLARVAFTALRQMFQYAVDLDEIPENPTANLNKRRLVGKDAERDRTLSEEEVRQLVKLMEDSGLLPTVKAAVWICLSTCCRIGELLKAKWEHIDFSNRNWTIPAENSKNGFAFDIHLSDFALRQFKTIQEINHDTSWLYPNREKNNHVCTKTITKQIGDRQRTVAMKNRSKKTATLTLPGGKWTPHDLRRTGSTFMGGLGVLPHIIDKCQNHLEPNKIRRTYQRHRYIMEMRDAWNLLGARLEELVRGEETAKIIPLLRSNGQPND